MEKNDDRELRRNQDKLINIGMGVIAFGVWSAVRTMMQMYVQRQDYIKQIKDGMETMSTEEQEMFSDAFIFGIFFAMMFVALAVGMGLRLYVGLSARSEGFGKKKGYGYLIVGFILEVIWIMSIVSSFTNSSDDFYDPLEQVVIVLIDITSVVIMIELFISAFRVKRMRKKHNSDAESLEAAGFEEGIAD